MEPKRSENCVSKLNGGKLNKLGPIRMYQSSSQHTIILVYIYIYIYIYTPVFRNVFIQKYIYIGAYFCLAERTQACMTNFLLLNVRKVSP